MLILRARQASQRGAVLILSLVMLLALTFIGVASMSNSTLQERIVGGARNNNLAFQSAEAALKYGIESAGTYTKSSIKDYDEFNRFVDEVPCGMVPDSFWRAPADLVAAPARPDCSFQNYNAEFMTGSRGGVEAFTPPPPICMVENSAPGSGGLRSCEQGSPVGLHWKIDAFGYGSNGAQVHLRSVYQTLKEDID